MPLIINKVKIFPKNMKYRQNKGVKEMSLKNLDKIIVVIAIAKKILSCVTFLGLGSILCVLIFLL